MQTVLREGTSWWLLPGAQLLESFLGPLWPEQSWCLRCSPCWPGFPLEFPRLCGSFLYPPLCHWFPQSLGYLPYFPFDHWVSGKFARSNTTHAPQSTVTDMEIVATVTAVELDECAPGFSREVEGVCSKAFAVV